MGGMDRPNTVAGLLEKRAELAGKIKFHRKELQKLICDLDHVDAAIRLFDPDADLKVTGKRYPTKHRAHKGEMVRHVLSYLRKAAGPVTSRSTSLGTRLRPEDSRLMTAPSC